MMQNSSKDILSAWHDYVKFSGAEKSKIPASKVHEHQQLMLGINNCEENQSGVVLRVTPEMRNHWRRRFVKYDEKGKTTHIEPVNLLFPVLRCIENERGKANVKYLPLFSFPLPKSFFEQNENTLLVPVKNGQLVREGANKFLI
ncbi:hypothetical protein ACKUTN_28980 [Klebsiella michiganensis]